MHNALWQSVLGEIELSVSHGNFETWFKNTELISYSDDEVTIGVINVFTRTQLEKKDKRGAPQQRHRGKASTLRGYFE